MTQPKLATQNDAGERTYTNPLTGRDTYPALEGRKQCSVEGCLSPTTARGWCPMHYYRWNKGKDIGTSEKQRSGPPSKTCTVPGCNRKHSGRGLCAMHAARRRRTGVVGEAQGAHDQLAEKTLLVESAALATGPGPCITWNGKLNTQGYLNISMENEATVAHRWVCQKAFGDPPSSLKGWVAHQPIICHNRACFRAGHLRWASKGENALDQYLDECWDNRETLSQEDFSCFMAVLERAHPDCFQFALQEIELCK